MARQLNQLLRQGGIASALLIPMVVLLGQSRAAADIDECLDRASHWCLEQGESGGGGPVSTPPSGGRPTGERPCGWVTVPADVVPPATTSRPVILTNGRPPEGEDVIWQGWCYKQRPGSPVYYFQGPFRWLPVGDPAAVVTLEDVAADAYEAIQGRMPEPTVVTSPPAGVDAVVDVPVFLTVTNWQVELVETGDLLGDVVTVRATPALVFSPAESGAEAVVCSGPGRVYDAALGDLWAQAAAPDACTYTYRHRTGVDGRPVEWPSVLTVRWSISWTSESGDGGVFPVVDRSEPIPRGVGEVQAVVVPGSG